MAKFFIKKLDATVDIVGTINEMRQIKNYLDNGGTPTEGLAASVATASHKNLYNFCGWCLDHSKIWVSRFYTA